MIYEKLSNVTGAPVLIKPSIIKDERGYFMEAFKLNEFKENIGDINFVQENESCSCAGTFRGLHFQNPPFAQAKLVKVVQGSAVDIIVDIRKGSPKYGYMYKAYLSGKNKYQFFVPEGYAHGFLALEDSTIFQYKCSNYYNKENERGILFESLESVEDTIEEFYPWQRLITSYKDNQWIKFDEFNSPFSFKEENHISKIKIAKI